MATTKVTEIMRRVVRVLNDNQSVRWQLLELQDWLNDAYVAIINERPDANVTVATITLAAGSKQSLTTLVPTATTLIDITRNMAASSLKLPIFRIDREVLDQFIPNWHNVSQSVDVQNWVHDLLTPKEFFVYPPATSAAQVEIATSSVPTKHTLTEEQLAPYASTAEVIKVDDTYANAIVDYVLYRAFLKDSETANAASVALHLGEFNRQIGAKAQVDVGVSKMKGGK